MLPFTIVNRYEKKGGRRFYPRSLIITPINRFYPRSLTVRAKGGSNSLLKRRSYANISSSSPLATHLSFSC